MPDTVHHDAAAHRFTLDTENGTARLDYTTAPIPEGTSYVLVHTEVPDADQGQGVATRLVAGALTQIRASGGRIVPQCPFVVSYLADHPDDEDLLAPGVTLGL